VLTLGAGASPDLSGHGDASAFSFSSVRVDIEELSGCIADAAAQIHMLVRRMVEEWAADERQRISELLTERANRLLVQIDAALVIPDC